MESRISDACHFIFIAVNSNAAWNNYIILVPITVFSTICDTNIFIIYLVIVDAVNLKIVAPSRHGYDHHTGSNKKSKKFHID